MVLVPVMEVPGKPWDNHPSSLSNPWCQTAACDHWSKALILSFFQRCQKCDLGTMQLASEVRLADKEAHSAPSVLLQEVKTMMVMGGSDQRRQRARHWYPLF